MHGQRKNPAQVKHACTLAYVTSKSAWNHGAFLRYAQGGEAHENS